MATVSVTSFAEFVTAIAVAGDTVVCPENAVWDMNELYPDGYTSNLAFNCAQVQGNGTTIKNLHMYGNINTSSSSAKCYFYNLHWVNFIGSSQSAVGFFNGCFFLRSCKISGILGAYYSRLLSHAQSYNEYSIDKCSVNIEATNSNFMLVSTAYGARYSRIEVRAANSTQFFSYLLDMKWIYCELVLYIPNETRIRSIRFSGCTIRGDLTSISIEESKQSFSGDVSVYDAASFSPNFTPRYPQYFVGVTEEQMKTPSYLFSVGFPIGVS